MAALSDDFTGAAGSLDGRVAPTGQVWNDINGTCEMDGSGRYIRNPDFEGLSSGSYLDTDLGARPTLMQAEASWTGTSADITENGAVVLISGNTSVRSGGASPNTGIFTDAIHAVFGLWQTMVNVYRDGTVDNTFQKVWNYAAPLTADGTVYTVGLVLDGARVGVQLPTGETAWIGHPDYDTLTGRHLIWQVYNANALDLFPRIESVLANDTYSIPTPPRVSATLTLGQR